MTMEPRKVLYCGACGMPPEYCEYGPDYETHCNPWLLKHDPNMHAELRLKSKRPIKNNKASAASNASNEEGDASADALPTRPWTTEERLRAFYEKYVPEKLDGIPALLEKYQGKEDKLFMALVKKYGSEPEDPYVAQFDSDSDDDDDDSVEGKMGGLKVSDKDKKLRRGAGAKTVNKVDTRVVIQKILRNKRKAVTIVVGMDTVPDIKLKDVAKAFSKRFAGSSSVKDMAGGGKEIIIQGDHSEDVATMIIDKFKVSPDCVFLDIDGEFVPMT
mmetsp:Transcript_4807/g.8454  ORF Transcript_4807/g.8454 Transcript_4807/m.8454 type:complete len:273 (-) Transcript_4807:225-1043(-)